METIDLGKLDEICCKLTECTNLLDDIGDELESECDIDAIELNRLSDEIWQFQKKLSRIIDEYTYGGDVDECELYHNKRQQMLDDEAWEARQRENV
jgi:hypothetical protein